MKRIIFGVIVFLASIGVVSADTTQYRVRYNTGSEVKAKRFDELNGYFDLYLDHEVEIQDYQKIHNIAYYANNISYELENITAQVMIWEEVYPDYTFEVIDDDDNVINLQYYRNTINRFIKKYTGPCELDGLVSEVVLNGGIMYVGKYKMSAYSADKYIVTTDDKYIHIRNITGVGTNTLHFTVIEDIQNNKIHATAPNMGDFSTTVIVLGNRINFEVIDNNSFIFEMYNNDTNELIGTYNVDSSDNYIEYSTGINVLLKDITSSTDYKLLDDITINEDDNHIYNVLLRPSYYQHTLTFLAEKVNDNYNIVNIDIYDSNDNYIDSLICNNTCNITLNEGSYKIINNNTLEESIINLQDNIEIDVSNNYLRALKGTYDVSRIFVNNKDISFHIEDNYIILDEYIDSNVISLLIEDNIYDVILDNYIYDSNFGLVKELSIELKEKIIEEEQIDDTSNIVVEPVNNDEENIVIIDIPNTEDNKDEFIYYYKKKYIYCTNNTYNCII